MCRVTEESENAKRGSGLTVSDNYECGGGLVNRMRRGDFWWDWRDDRRVALEQVQLGVMPVTGKSGSRGAALQMWRLVCGFLQIDETEFFWRTLT